MEDTQMIEQALQDYKKGVGTFTKKMPKIAEKFNAFTEECFAKGKLEQKHKQLIALALGVNAQDEYCIIFHTKGCIDQGCTEEEILEAVGVAAAFGGGAALSQAVTLVQDAITQFNQNSSGNSGSEGQYPN